MMRDQEFHWTYGKDLIKNSKNLQKVRRRYERFGGPRATKRFSMSYYYFCLIMIYANFHSFMDILNGTRYQKSRRFFLKTEIFPAAVFNLLGEWAMFSYGHTGFKIKILDRLV